MQNNIEDVVKKSTLMWKVIYGLQIIKEGQEDPFEGRNDGEEEEENEKEKEGEKEKEVEKETQKGDMTTIEKQQHEYSVQDTQLPPPNPAHTTPTPIESITINDVPDISC